MKIDVFIHNGLGTWETQIFVEGRRHKTINTLTRWGVKREAKKTIKNFRLWVPSSRLDVSVFYF